MKSIFKSNQVKIEEYCFIKGDNTFYVVKTQDVGLESHVHRHIADFVVEPRPHRQREK